MPSPQPTTTSLFDPKNITMAVTGDIHLGHMRTHTSKIIQALLRAFPNTAEMDAIDLIVLNGDVFDYGLRFDSDLRSHILLFVVYLLRLCKRRDIVLRVLEGTPGHDHRQSAIFSEVNAAIGADCRYIDTLHIEYIERFNAHMLYVPDEWRATATQTQQEVKELLAANGVRQVDYAFMHGYFHYQLPAIAQQKEEAHDIDYYESIVKHDIFISHVHTFSQRGKVTAPGSIERLTHGEEEDKGHVIRTPKGTTFVVNKESQLYITVPCHGMALEAAYSHAVQTASPLPSGSHVRIAADRGDPILTTIAQLRKEVDHVTWTDPVTGKNKDSATIMDPIMIQPLERIPTLTSDNILSHMTERLRARHPDIADACLQILNEEKDAT